MSRTHKATVYWERDGEELEVEISVGAVSYDPHEYGSREVEVISVRDTNGLRPDLEDAIPTATLERLYSKAIRDVVEREDSAREDEDERRAEDRRRCDW